VCGLYQVIESENQTVREEGKTDAAEAVCEGGKAGASKDDDRRKVAGHANERQSEKYDRDQVEAFRRTMKSRASYRENEK
jgi:hypothetical protein